MTLNARLEIVEARGPLEFGWTFSDADVSTSGLLILDPSSSAFQLVTGDHQTARLGGASLRANTAQALRTLLGPVLADCLAQTSSHALLVKAPHAAQVALDLPYGLLMRHQVPRVIRTLSPFENSIKSWPDPENRITAAFSLVADEPYLPLHREAECISRTASKADLALREFFICFDFNRFLAYAAGSRIVHLAGHGSQGTFRCMMGNTNVLGSDALIAAWKHAPPGLVILNFCESSSERDSPRFGALARAQALELDLLWSQRLHGTGERTSSMALDLAAALPTSVLALRLPVDDIKTRRFIGRFYELLLIEQASVADSCYEAIDELDFFDDLGLPVPVLYQSRAGSDSTHLPRVTQSRKTDGFALGPQERRIINIFYNAFAPLSHALGRGKVLFEVTGSDPELHLAVQRAIGSLVANNNAMELVYPSGTGLTKVSQRELQASARLYDCVPGTPSDFFGAGMIELEDIPSDVALGELRDVASTLQAADYLLLSYAACNVPGIVDAVSKSDVNGLVSKLRRVAAARSEFERHLRSDLVQVLLRELPDRLIAQTRIWLNAQWESVVNLGSVAVDIAASRYLLGRTSHLLPETQRMLSYYLDHTQIDAAEISEKCQQLINEGIAKDFHLALLDAGNHEQFFSINLFLASRAWSACSPEARKAYLEAYIDRELALESLDQLQGWSTARLTRTAQACVENRDNRLWGIIAEIRGRPDGVVIAEYLAEVGGDVPKPVEADRLSPILLTRQVDDLISQFQYQAAAQAIAQIRAGADLRDERLAWWLEVKELMIAAYTLQPDAAERLIEFADDLESRLPEREVLIEALDDDLYPASLFVIRHARASALSSLGRTEEAAGQLAEAFFECIRTSANQATKVAAGYAAVAAAAKCGLISQTRELADQVRAIAGRPRPSRVSILAHCADIEACVLDGRHDEASRNADVLLSLLADWEPSKGLDVLRTALLHSAIAYQETERAVSAIPLLALIIRLDAHADGSGAGPDYSPFENLARNLSHSSLDNVHAVAEQVFTQLARLLTRMGITFEDCDTALEGLVSFIHHLGESNDLQNELLDPSIVERLQRRATGGCDLSCALIAAAANNTTQPMQWPGIDVNPHRNISLRALAQEHGRLLDIFRDSVTEKFVAGLPLVRAANHGDMLARFLMFGVLMGDYMKESGPGPIDIYTRLTSGDPPSSLIQHLGSLEVGNLMQAAIAIEECVISESLRETESDRQKTSQLASIGFENWRAILSKRGLDQALRHFPSGIALIRALRGAFGKSGLARLLEVDLSSEGVAREFPHLAEVVKAGEISWDRLVFTVITLLISTDEPELGLTGARRLANHEDPTIAATAQILLFDSLKVSDPAEAAENIAALMNTISQLDPWEEKWLKVVNILSAGGLEVGRPDLSAEGNRLLLSLMEAPEHYEEPYLWLVFNWFVCLIVMEEWGPAVELLRDASSHMDFALGCCVFSPHVPSIPEERASDFIGVLLLMERNEPRSQYAGEVQEGVDHLYSSIEGLVSYSGLRRRIEEWWRSE